MRLWIKCKQKLSNSSFSSFLSLGWVLVELLRIELQSRHRLSAGLQGSDLWYSTAIGCVPSRGVTQQDSALTYCQHMLESRTSSDGWHCLIVQEMLLLLLPLLNSSSVKKLLLPFSKDKSTSSSGEEADCPICRSSLSIPFIALPCQHRYSLSYRFPSKLQCITEVESTKYM